MLAHVECAAPARPRLFVGESLAELREEAPDRLEYFANLRPVAEGRWRTDVPLAFRYLRFEKGDARYAFYGWRWGKSLCHAWSAWPAFLYVSEAMGARPTSDGWATYEMDPIPGAEGMRATVPTPRGDLSFAVDAAP